MCFHEGAEMVVIDNEVCIDCGACVDKCPVQAIYTDETLPEKWRSYVALNTEYSAKWPVITLQREALPAAEEFKSVEDKTRLFNPAPGSGDSI